MEKFTELLGPRAPYRGCRSDSSVSTQVPPGSGYWADAINVVQVGSLVEVRKGATTLFTNPLPSGCTALVDWWAGTVAGVECIYGAFRDSTPKIRVYRANSVGLSSSSTWTEVTTSSGTAIFGNTRLADATKVALSPAKVIGVSAFDPPECVIVSNGTTSRVFGVGSTYDGAQVQSPSSSDPLAAVSVIAKHSSFWQVAQSSAWGGGSFSNSAAARWAAAASGAPYNASGRHCISVTRDTTASTNPTARIDFGASPTLNAALQLHLMWDGTSGNLAILRGSVKIEVSADDITYETLYDPSSTSSAFQHKLVKYVDVTSGTTTIQQWTMDTKGLTTSTALRYMKLTYVGSAPSSSVTAVLIGAYGSSVALDGASEFAVAYQGPSGVESPGFATYRETKMANLNTVGGPNGVNASGSSVAPPDLPGPYGDIYYDMEVSVYNPSAGTGTFNALTDARPVQANVYFKPGPDSGEYAFLEAIPLLVYTSSWAYQYSTNYANYTLTRAKQDVDQTRRLPSSFNVAPPPSTCIFKAFDRLFAVAPYMNSQTQGREVWFSEQGSDMRFQPFALSYTGDADESLASSARLPEDALGGISAGASDGSASQVFVWTAKRMYTLGGAAALQAGAGASQLSTASAVCSHGLGAVRAFCETEGRVFWLDQNLDLIEYAGGRVENRSFQKFSEEFSSVPASRRPMICMAAKSRRVYIGVTPSGGSLNTRLVVYSLDLKEKEAVWTISGEDFERLCLYFDSVVAGRPNRLLTFSSTGKVGALGEHGTGDYGGTGVSPSLATGDIVPQNGQGFIRYVMVSGASQSAKSWTVTRTYPNSVYLSSISMQDPFNSALARYSCEDTLASPDTGYEAIEQGGSKFRVGIAASGITPGKTVDFIGAQLVPMGIYAGMR